VNIVEQLKTVLALAKDINRAEPSENEDEHVLRIDSYLIELDAWQMMYKDQPEDSISEPEKAQLKICLGELELEHSLLIAKANGLMKEVKQEMNKVNKTSKALKKYIDSPGFQSKGLFKKG